MAIIITETTCDLDYKEIQTYKNTEMIPLTVNFGEEHYKDQIDLSKADFYEKLEQVKEIPTTSLLNPSDFLEVFEKYPNEDLIVITISHKFSGTYQSACIAKEMCDRENIHVIDSGTATIGQGILVKVAVAMNDKKVDTLEIVNRLIELKEKVRLVAVIDTLKYLVKGGRLSGVQGAVGTVLRVKPIIRVTDGEIISLAKARGSKSAFKELASIIEEDGEVDNTLPILFAHTNSKEMLEEFKQNIPYVGEEAMIGSVVGTHVGPGAVAIAYFVK